MTTVNLVAAVAFVVVISALTARDTSLWRVSLPREDIKAVSTAVARLLLDEEGE